MREPPPAAATTTRQSRPGLGAVLGGGGARDISYKELAPSCGLRHARPVAWRSWIAPNRGPKGDQDETHDGANPDAATLGQKLIAAHAVEGHMKALRADFRARLGAVLSPEQKAKLERLDAPKERGELGRRE